MLENVGKICRFSGRLRPDWEKYRMADTAGLGLTNVSFNVGDTRPDLSKVG